MSLAIREAGKTWPNAVAGSARPPTSAATTRSRRVAFGRRRRRSGGRLHQPVELPLAIFTGEVAAALAAAAR
jgi:delta 1-pyrroline-5-carboxylate dehydrogenase